MPRYTLRQLNYFMAVAEAGSITGAAQRLHVSHTAVSSALSELERLLHAQLLVRRKAHGVTLTPTGSYLLSRASELLEAAEELELSVASSGEELVGPLVVGSYVTVAPTVLPPLWEGFAARHPKVELTFVTGTQDEIPMRLLDGELDLAIVYDMALPRGVRSVLLYVTTAHIIMPSGHRLADAEAIALGDLAEDPMVLLEAPPSSEHTMRLFEDAGVEPRIRYRTTDYEFTRSLVARGVGYAVMVQRPAADVSYEGLPLVAKPIVPPARPVRVLMIWPEAVRLSDRARAMVVLAADSGLRSGTSAAARPAGVAISG
ncbi:LysR family transcriptional regulator [Georgenia sp. EYE_87]|uniref:LysR family transcriptional regulator n=1 Tax=Georgenia sp. EYE_87 TaxID=2853448 RepID=UPI002006170E|nr:LysR family transcriptional regulator [Georgenia sp. EYE_87]MCK6210544.1 LysR family transcriptional regulator [Georgenia sp. EYE_87]